MGGTHHPATSGTHRAITGGTHRRLRLVHTNPVNDKVFNRSEGKSRKTVAWYNETLQDFIRYLERQGIAATLAEADELVVRRYTLDLQSRQVNGKPISSHTVNCRVRGLRAFYNWLFQQKYTRRNLLERLKPPKPEVNIPEILTEEEIARLLVLPQFMGSRIVILHFRWAKASAILVRSPHVPVAWPGGDST